MSDELRRLASLPRDKAALLRDRLAAQRARPCEPIAVIGLGCRFPGADGPDAYWDLLANGVDAIGPVPPDRWDAAAIYDPDPNRPGHATTREGGFVADVDRFDPDFFGISRREADRMDPQQRLLLQVAWAALEHAGIAPSSLQGTRTGVFVGASSGDYRVLALADLDAVDMYAGTGNAHAILANRLSYLLDLRGPSLAIDTACSSSLVAAHLAARALTSGDCDRALVAGVHLALTPHLTVGFSRARMLSPDGRCRTFDADASGYGRGEGCGVVVLRRLVDALADGDRVLAVLRGTAVNQDGRSNGLTAPSGLAQEAVIRAALADARVAPEGVSLVEAHGTATALGDPIEVTALCKVFGEGAAPLAVGSVKTQIGHLEPAAGVAGLIKAVLALRHEVIPPTLHLRRPNPLLPIEGTRLRFPTEAVPWPAIDGRRVAGVSSFGFGGTNAHVVLEQAPPTPAPSEAPGPHLLVLSARTGASLAEAAATWADALDRCSLADAAYTAALGRAHFPEARLALVAVDEAEAARALRAFAAGEAHPALVSRPGEGRIAFAYTGQGSQWPGMGRELAERYPVFRDALARCLAIVPELEPMLLGDDPAIHRTEHAQPALFAWCWAMTELLASLGVRPAAVTGHSLGELVAATVAGRLTVEDGLRLAVTRGRLMQAQRADGAMAAARCSEAELVALLADHPGVALAAVNGPRAVTVGGDADAVHRLVGALTARGIGATPLRVSHAFHSHHMDPAVAPFEAAVAEVELRPATLPLVVGLGDDAASWGAHLRGAVRFADAVGALLAEPTRFVEIGPVPHLTALGAQLGGAWLPTAPDQLLRTVGALHLAGVPIAWSTLQRGRLADLPTYRFARTRCWVEPASAPSEVVGGSFLGERLRLPGVRQAVFQARHGATRPTWLAHHRLFGRVISPAAAHIGLALAGLRALGLRRALTDLSFPHALRFADGEEATLQLVIDDEGGAVQVLGLGAEDVVHATGRLAEPRAAAIERVREAPDRRDVAGFYEAWDRAGYQLGASFRWITEAWRGPGRARVRLAPPAGAVGLDDAPLFPGLLDSCFQALTLCLDEALVDGVLDGCALFVPVAVERLTLGEGGAGGPLTAHVHLRRSSERQQVADLLLEDADGRVVAEVEGLTVRRVPRALLLGVADEEPTRAFEVVWRDVAPSAGTGERARVVATASAAAVLPADVEARVLPDDPVAACAQLAAWALDGGRLALVTRGAMAVDGDRPSDGDGAALWGFRRALEAELPGTVRAIDLDPLLPAVPEVLAAELAADTPEVAWRAGRRLVPRLAPASTAAWRAEALERGVGGIEALALRPLEPEPPGPGEVEITVRASCLNFRDVLGTLGVYPGDPGPLGGECCGIVRRVGAGVDGLAVGQRVTAALARTGTLRAHAVADARFVAPVPDDVSDLDAATAPVAYATASYGLERLAELAPGDRVLIHAASGGVGLAAVHLALARGCEVIGTAGSPEKRALLSALGLAQVCDSRSTTYEAELTARWGDRPVDVVLNSLGAEHVAASLRLVAPGGRFVEIGKADVLDAARAAALDRVAYHAFDLAAVSVEDPDGLGALLQDVARRRLPPLPRRAFPVAQAQDAFRRMARASHVGRLALVWPEAPQERVRPGARYVVTGGLGALGLHAARWLAEAGATDLVLLGRSAPDERARRAIASLSARVEVVAADVTDAQALAALGPIAGVVHAAGVLDDALLADVTEASLARVLHPKVDGARAVREAFPDAWLLLYSSAVGTVGAAGQAAYAAANAWLDQAAIGWSATGGRARSIGWGPWDRGMAAHTDAGAQARWRAMGIAPVTEASGAAALAADGPAHAVVMAFDARRAHPLAVARAPAIVAELLEGVAVAAPEEAPSDMLGFLQATLRAVLELPPDAPIDPRRPLPDLGVDSLMAAELVARVQGRLGRTIRAADLVDHPTLASLAAWLDGAPEPGPGPATAPAAAAPAFEVLEF